MINQLIPLFDKNANSYQSDYSQIIDSLELYHRVSISMIKELRSGKANYSNTMPIVKTTLHDIEIVKDYLLSLNQIYYDERKFNELLKKTLNIYSSINIQLINFESSFKPNEKKIKKSKRIPEKEIKSMKWSVSLPTLDMLIKLLLKGRYISKKDNQEKYYEHFFNENLTSKELEPINWKKSKVLLAYFIQRLFEEDFIKPIKIWRDTSIHFKKNGETPKYLGQSINNYPYPNGSQEIDEIIKKIS